MAFSPYPGGQLKRQVVELGCKKYPGLQLEHWLLVESSHELQAELQASKFIGVVSDSLNNKSDYLYID